MIKQRLEPERRRDEVAAALRTRITAGEWAPGALMPSVRELAAEYHCSPTDSQAALRILRDEGLVIIIERRGTIVAWPQQSIAGPGERMERSANGGGLFRPAETVELLRAEVVEDAPVGALSAFGLPEDAPLGLREYVVRADSKIVTYGSSYVHPDVWHQVPELHALEPIPDGIIGAIRRATGRQVAAVPTQRKADHATDEEAARLGVAQDAPVLVEVTECVADDGVVVEWNLSVHPRGYWVGQ